MKSGLDMQFLNESYRFLVSYNRFVNVLYKKHFRFIALCETRKISFCL